jgi:Ca-activated chloride channel homolog
LRALIGDDPVQPSRSSGTAIDRPQLGTSPPMPSRAHLSWLICAFACARDVGPEVSRPPVDPPAPAAPPAVATEALPAQVDLCPDEEETPNSFRDDDGCPDEPVGGMAYFANGLRPVSFVRAPLPREGARLVPWLFFSTNGFPQVSERHSLATLGRFVDTAVAPRASLAASNDTAALPLLRRFLARGALPPIGSLHIESLVDYFSPTSVYAFDGHHPPDVKLEVGPCPWRPGHRLARVQIEAQPWLPRAQTVILMLDRSPSMSTPERLPLLKQGIATLLDNLAILGSGQRVAILAFDRDEQVVLPPTPIGERAAIDSALAGLRTRGGSNGRARLDLAYELADRRSTGEHVHIVVASDGADALWYPRESPTRRRPNTTLTVIGVGGQDFDGHTLAQLAADNDGAVRYVDTAAEAQRLFARLATQGPIVAGDLQFQAVFDPAIVARYHLVGHVNDEITADDFRRDTPLVATSVDGPQHSRRRAADLAAGQSMTLLFELVPAGSAPVAFDLTVRARIEGRDRRTSYAVRDTGVELAATTSDFRFLAAVAELGLLVQGGPRGEASPQSQQSCRLGREGQPSTSRGRERAMNREQWSGTEDRGI